MIIENELIHMTAQILGKWPNRLFCYLPSSVSVELLRSFRDDARFGYVQWCERICSQFDFALYMTLSRPFFPGSLPELAATHLRLSRVSFQTTALRRIWSVTCRRLSAWSWGRCDIKNDAHSSTADTGLLSMANSWSLFKYTKLGMSSMLKIFIHANELQVTIEWCARRSRKVGRL